MSAFSAMFAAAVQPLLAVQGERVVLTPSGRSARPILAIVERQPLDTRPEEESAAPRFEMAITVDAAEYGALTLGGDTIKLKRRPADTAAQEATLTVTHLIDSSAGTYRLGLT